MSIAKGIADGLREAIAHAKGEALPGTNEVTIPNVKSIREQLGMSQGEFSKAYQIPAGTLKGWEQGRRKIDAPAAALLRTIEKYPDIVKAAQKRQG